MAQSKFKRSRDTFQLAKQAIWAANAKSGIPLGDWPPKSVPAQKPQGKGKKGQQFDAWKSNMFYNDGNRARQIQWLEKEVMNKQQRGVEVYRTK